MADVPGTPTTLSSMGATALRKILFSSKLRQPKVLPSIFTNLVGQAKIVDKQIVIEKSGIITEINATTSRDINGFCGKYLELEQAALLTYGHCRKTPAWKTKD